MPLSYRALEMMSERWKIVNYLVVMEGMEGKQNCVYLIRNK